MKLAIPPSMLLFGILAAAAAGQSTAFTYQGRLNDDGLPANGAHDFRFRLFDAPTGGNQVGVPVCVDNFNISDGLFEVRLDFGPQFASPAPRYLRIEVRRDAGHACLISTGYVELSPRQEVTSVPLSTHAKSAFALAAADGSPASAVTTDGNGNVGIGTGAPAASLHVVTADGEGIRIQGPAVGAPNGAYITFADSAGTDIGYVGDGSSGDRNTFLASYVQDVELITPAGRVLTASANGNVGIRTQAPIAGLHVNKEPIPPGGTLALEGTTHAYMSFFPDGVGAGRKGHLGYPSATSNSLTITNEPGTFIALSPNGGVGIGTAFPNRRLTVWDTMSVEASPGFMPILGVPRPGLTTYRTAMFVSDGEGVVSGDRKSFREINPDDPTTDIWYVCLEGPEAAMYVRGTSRLANGRGLIDLPAHFLALASEKGMTVQLTPLSGHSKGLAVTRKGHGGVQVAELNGGRGTYEFDWHVTAVRRRYENYEVVKPWDETLPSDSDRAAAWQERMEEINRHR